MTVNAAGTIHPFCAWSAAPAASSAEATALPTCDPNVSRLGATAANTAPAASRRSPDFFRAERLPVVRELMGGLLFSVCIGFGDVERPDGKRKGSTTTPTTARRPAPAVHTYRLSRVPDPAVETSPKVTV